MRKERPKGKFLRILITLLVIMAVFLIVGGIGIGIGIAFENGIVAIIGFGGFFVTGIILLVVKITGET